MTKRSPLHQIFWIYVVAFILVAFGFSAEAKTKKAPKKSAETPSTASTPEKAATSKESKADKKEKNMIAVFETNKGTFEVKLFNDKAPKTVKNFTDLAEGKKEWKDPKTGKMVKKPFYDGLIFHRVIDGFMLQGGDPEGSGSGGPGYTFEDEFGPGLKHDKPGMLSMANRGPNTNGSQFFVTVAATPWLDGRHAIFGEVVKNMDVVNAIAKVSTGPGDKPVEDVVIKKVTIVH